VALGTSYALPDMKGQVTLSAADAQELTGSGGIGGGNEFATRAQQVLDRTSRSNARAMAIGQQPAQDIWLLPLRTNYEISSIGTPYYAAGSGTVILARVNGGYGWNVMIRHDGGVVTVYGHSSRLVCKEGQHVEAGDLIGYTGNTGFSTGPHLHFEIRINDRPTEPIAFMRARGVDIRSRVEVAKGGILS
jgi:hypothetical protein